MKKLEIPKAPDPAGQDAEEAEAERELDLELFEKYEMPIFLKDVAQHGITPAESLTAMQAIFFLDTTPPRGWRGRLPTEQAKAWYEQFERGFYT